MKEGAVSKRDVMIVDDSPANLNLLEEILTRLGYEVRSFPLGRLALAAAMKDPPDLILLDVHMPEMTGYEVCELLKSTAELADIPVIFLSGLSEAQDKAKAFRAGARDYIAKPFRLEEIQVRVETQLQLRELQCVMKRQNDRLDRLSMLDRSKNELLQVLSKEFREEGNGSRGRILSILDDALLLTRVDLQREPVRSAPVSLQHALARGIERAAAFAASRRVAIGPPPAEPDMVVGDEALLARALHALLETAVEYSEAGETVRLSRGVTPDSTTVVIESRGRTIPDESLATFFEIFPNGDAATTGEQLRLGPPLAYRILAIFGTSVSVANRNGSGIRLTITLNRTAPEAGQGR